MKHYKDTTGNLYSYEDNVKDSEVKEGLTSITQAEYEALMTPTQARIESDFRAERDILLKTKVDYYQLVLIFNSLSPTQQTELATYRQELLDATLSWTMPTAPAWMA